MTVIVAALTSEQGIVMAADRLVSAGWQKLYHQDPKLWVTEKFLLGAAGDLRTAQVVKHHVTWPKYRPDEDADLEEWLVKTLVPAIRAGIKDQGVVKSESGVESLDAGLLWATGDLLAGMNSHCDIVVATSGRMAIGSGYAEALGRLGDQGPWTEADVIDAARRAIQSDRGCDGPISVADTKTLTVRTAEEGAAHA